ncbi:MAG: HvfC/BufC family peptide modification chaperone [Rhodospirillales bacterium]
MAALANTPPLDRLQADFMAYIRGDDAAMAGRTRATRKASAETLLGVYRSAYPLRLLEAMETNFPRLKVVLGDADFDRMGRGYIALNPPRHFSIRWYGGGLAAYLRETDPWRAAPALAELAGFEWALAGCFDAADAPVLDAAAVGAIAPGDWPGMTLLFHPSLRAFDSHWTVPELWNALENAGDGAPAPKPAKRPAPAPFALWRQEGQVRFRSLTPDEAAVLAAARAGRAFAALCELLAGFVPEPEAGTRAAQLLRAWVEQGWIVRAGA